MSDADLPQGDPALVRPRQQGTAPRAGARAFVDIDRVDVIWLLVLVVSAFLLRIGSPIFPNALSHPLSQAPVAAWGLGFPYNNPYPNQSPEAVPADAHGNITHGTEPLFPHYGFVFDEVYFPVDAAKDVHQPAIDHFDPSRLWPSC